MSDLTPSDPPPSYAETQHLLGPNSQGGPPDSSRSPRGPRPPMGPPPPLDLPALNSLRGQRIVLASNSPRRKFLLAQIGLTNIDIVPSTFAEDLPKSMSPFEYVLETASEKAREVYRREIDNENKGEPALLLAADTIIISHGGQILEKPRSPGHHMQMLKMLRDEGTHKVVTAVAAMTPKDTAITPGYRMETHVEETTVKFDPNITDDLLLAYIKTRDGNDKAGGYGIQSGGAILIERIEGSFDNVVGLPLRATLNLIEKVMTPDSEEEDGEMYDMFSPEE